MRRRVFLQRAGGGLAALGLCGTLAACSTGPARVPLILVPDTGGGGGGQQVDTSALRLQAETIVRISFPQAILVEMIGTPAGATATAVADLNVLQFRFGANQTNPAAGTAWVDATNGRFGPVLSSSQQLTDVTFTELPRSLTLDQAVTLMRNAGFEDPFRRVIFRRLPGAAAEPTYAFETAARWILVGARTGTVSESATQPEPDPLLPGT